MNLYEWMAEYRVPPLAYSKKDIEILYRNAGVAMSRHQRVELIKTAKKPKGITLWDELKNIGYQSRRNYFTKKEVELIFEYIGEPDLTFLNEMYLIDKQYISSKDISIAEVYRMQK